MQLRLARLHTRKRPLWPRGTSHSGSPASPPSLSLSARGTARSCLAGPDTQSRPPLRPYALSLSLRSDAEWRFINNGCMPPVCDTYRGSGYTCPEGCIFDDKGSANEVPAGYVESDDTCTAPDCRASFDGSEASCMDGCTYAPALATDDPVDCAAFARNASLGVGNCEAAWAIGLNSNGKWVNAYQACELSCGKDGSYARTCDLASSTPYSIPYTARVFLGLIVLAIAYVGWKWRVKKAPVSG
jgi:hypothetical protein